MKTTTLTEEKEITPAKLDTAMKKALYEIKCFFIDYYEKLDKLNCVDEEPTVYSSRMYAEMLQDEREKQKRIESITSNVFSMFEKVGINPRLEGARFLSHCIFISCANPEYGIMKIYEIVARKLGTNAQRVGRACRYACRTADLSKLPAMPYYDKGILLDFNETSPTAKQVVYAFAMLMNDQFDFRKIV